jgi:CheY-like chemotaxis protein
MRSEIETAISADAGAIVNATVNSIENSETLRAGISAAKSGDRTEARDLLFQVTENDPQNEAAWLWLASISEYPEELLANLDKVLSINPANEKALDWRRSTKALMARNLVQRGVSAAQGNQFDVAIRSFTQAIEFDDANEMAWLWLASVSESNEEKIRCLEKVVSLNPGNEMAASSLRVLKPETIVSETADSNGETELDQEIQSGQHEFEMPEGLPVALSAEEVDEVLDLAFTQNFLMTETSATENAVNTVVESHIESAVQTTRHTAELEQGLVEKFAACDEDVAIAAEIAEMEMMDVSVEADDTSVGAEPAPTLEQAVDADPTYNNTEFTAENESNPASEFTAEQASQLVDEVAAEAAQDQNQTQNDEIVNADAAESMTAEITTEFASQMETQQGDEESESFEMAQQTDYESAPQSEYVSEFVPETQSQFFGYEDQNVAAVSYESFEALAEEEIQLDHDYSDVNVDADSFAVAEEIQTPSDHITICNYCAAENFLHAPVCVSCRSMLVLSDIGELINYNDANKDTLAVAIARLEKEQAAGNFGADDYVNLALAHLNAGNSDSGLMFLQRAYILSPSDQELKHHIDDLSERIKAAKPKSLQMSIDDTEVPNVNLEAKTAAPTSIESKTILVVDDSPTIRKLVSAKLEKHGHEVVVAVDGMDALSKLNEVVPDLVLLDITMPRLDGYQVCKLIRANEATKDVPVILISGKDGFFDKVRGRMSGSSGYITKPFGPETLIKTVVAFTSDSEAV